jgi:hypothetical protein
MLCENNVINESQYTIYTPWLKKMKANAPSTSQNDSSFLQGLISEAQMDCLNLPVYVASPKEITKLVERNCNASKIINIKIKQKDNYLAK